MKKIGNQRNSSVKHSYVAINMRDEQLCLAQVSHQTGLKPSVEMWLYGSVAANQLQAGLEKIKKKLHLQKQPCTSILPSRAYRVLVIDPLDVPEEEQELAIKWHMQELLNKPVDEMTVSLIQRPKGLDKKQKQSVVVADDQRLARYIEPLHQASLNLQVVDIEEMAQRNIACLLDEDKFGVAVVVVGRNHSLITISRGGELFFSRRIMVGETQLRNADQAQGQIDQLLIEVQRSLDFYSANLRQSVLGKVYFSENVESLVELFEQAKKNITAKLAVLHLADLFNLKEQKLSWSPIGFYTLGAALREVDNATA